MEPPVHTSINKVEITKNENEILGNEPERPDERPSNVLMSHAGDDSIFNKTEVLAGQRLFICSFASLTESYNVNGESTAVHKYNQKRGN